MRCNNESCGKKECRELKGMRGKKDWVRVIAPAPLYPKWVQYEWK
jgi:hypothetical protein